MDVSRLSRRPLKLPIGLDVGEAGLRLVQLKDSGGRLAVHRSVVSARELEEDGGLGREAVVERLSHFVKQTDFVGRRVVTALSLPTVELHPLELPLPTERTAKAEFRRAAAWEIGRLTTLDKERVQTDVWALPESKRSAVTYMGVAAHLDEVEGRLQMCDAARLDCIKVDVSCCALAGWVWHMRDRPKNQVWGVLDAGYRNSRLMICIDDVPVMVRSFGMGGQVWTERIASSLKLSMEAAERNKVHFGVAVAEDADGPPELKELSILIRGILRDDLQRLALETERSYEYILQCYAPRIPGELVMVGGGARLKGLDDYLASQLGIQVLPVGRCSKAISALADAVVDCGGLETCALACALSWQGWTQHAQR